MGKKKSSLKSTIAVSLTNYLDAGAIVAGASGLTLWQNYLGLTEGHLGWLNAISANCLGAAIGAIMGGFLADKYGRKAIYTYNMLVYMTGVALIMLSVNFPMLLAGFLITGISVGVGVPASWTYISENSEVGNRGRNIGISQMAWGIGPTIILILGTLLAPPTSGAESAGVLFAPVVESLAGMLTGGTAEGTALNVFSSRIVFASLFIVAFIAWLLQRRLDESEEWKAEKAKQGDKQQGGVFSSFGSLFTNKVNIRTILFLAGIYLTWNLVSSVMGFFQQHIYETAGGLSNQHANMLSVAQWVIIIVTTFVFSMIVDKVNQRWLYFFGVGMGVLAWVIIALVLYPHLGYPGGSLRAIVLRPMGFRAISSQVQGGSPGRDVLHRARRVGPVGARLRLHLRSKRRGLHHRRLHNDGAAAHLPRNRDNLDTADPRKNP